MQGSIANQIASAPFDDSEEDISNLEYSIEQRIPKHDMLHTDGLLFRKTAQGNHAKKQNIQMEQLTFCKAVWRRPGSIQWNC